MRLTHSAAALALLVSLGFAPGFTTCVRAQDLPASDETEARALFEAGREAFTDGRFDEALAHFTRSYELSHRPILTFNIASAHDRLGHVVESIEWFERYLEVADEPENRSFVEARLVVLRRMQGEAAHADSAIAPVDETAQDAVGPSDGGAVRDEGEASTSDESGAIASGVLFTLAGLAGVGGVAMGAYSLSLQSDLDARCPDDRCDDGARGQVDTLTTTALVTDILLGTSLAAAIGATIALLVHASGQGSATSEALVTPVVGSGVAGARLRLRF